MQTEQIVALLVAERDRLTRAIDALRGMEKAHPTAKKAAPSAASAAVKKAPTPISGPSAPAKRTLSAAGRKAIAEGARKRWALIKAGKAVSPFAKVAKKKA